MSGIDGRGRWGIERGSRYSLIECYFFSSFSELDGIRQYRPLRLARCDALGS